MRINKFFVALGLIATVAALPFSVANAQEADIASVDTGWAIFSRPDQIHLRRFDDPSVPVTCYITRAVGGGVMPQSWMIGHADFAINCVQKRDTHIDVSKLPKQETLFSGNDHWFQRFMNITRVVDQDRKTIVYMSTPSIAMKGADDDHSSISVVEVKE